LLFVAVAACQAQTTQPTAIFDNKINNEGGIGWTGSISILSRSVTPSGVTLAPAGATLRVVNGSLSAQLYPGTYQATYVGTPKVSLWTVPLSGPVTVHAIESNITPLPSPSPTITASQIVGLGLGSIIYGGPTGTVQLAAPSDGVYCTNFTASIPSYYSACGGGGGSVISVFGRTGVVVAGIGDYTAAQVTNAVNTAGSYTNPSWLTLTYAGGRMSGVQPTITTGTTLQYFRGDLSLAAFPSFQDPITNYSFVAGLTGYPSTFPPVNSGDWAGTWQTHAPAYFQTAISNYSTISALSGYPSTFPPTNSGDWAGTWQTHAPGYFQAALTNYSTISGLTGYPSTFPPTNSGDWAGTWNSHAVAYFQTALTTYSTISGLSGYPSTFAAAAHNLLSATHGDTTASSAVRGGGIFAVGATPSWTQVAHSSATGGYWKWNGTDVVASTGAAAGTGSCTNQVVTATGADASPTCSTVTSGMVDNSIAATGGDINTSNQVTATHLSSALPVNQGGTGATSIPTWNQNTTGTAAGLSATLAIASGGTNATAAAIGSIPGATSTSASAWTTTPTLGNPGTSTGTLAFGSATGAGTWTLGASPSTTSNTMLGPTAVPATGAILTCATSSTTCTVTSLPDVAVGSVLASGGVGAAPGYVAASGLTVSAASTATTATNLASGIAGNIPIQTAAATTGYVAPNAVTGDAVLTSHAVASAYASTAFQNAPALSAANMTSFPTLNQSTSGTAANVTGVVAIANGGTGSATAAANTVFAGPTTGSAAAPSFQTAPTISAANMTSFPTLNQNTSGTAAGLSATLAVASGGTGTASTLTGLVRGSASAMTATELSGDVTTSGSNAVTVSKINGTAFAGTSGHVVSFGALNTPADSGIVATAITQTIASGALALATSSINYGSCQTVTTGSVNSVAATGVALTDAIAFTPNGSIKAVTGFVPGTSGGLTVTGYPTSGYVNFDVCNWSGSPITPGAVTLNWRVTR
jgi:hypothetical protein